MGSSVTIVTAIASMAPGYTVYCPPSQPLYPFLINAPLYVVCTQQPLRQRSAQLTAHRQDDCCTRCAVSATDTRACPSRSRISLSCSAVPLPVVNGGNFTYTGILQNAVFGFAFMGAVQDGDADQIYNITSGQSGNALATCNTTATTSSCSTPVTYVMTGNPYELETFQSRERNYTNGQADSNYTYSIIVLPPVPAQPTMFVQYSGSNNVSTGSFVATVSQYSTEYGSALTGCLLHYGPTPYQPSNVPTLLNNTSQLPANAVTYMSVGQNSTQVITPAKLSNPPAANVGYDYHFSCYNGNGQSPEVILYNVSVAKNSAASLFGGGRALLVGLLGAAVTAATLLL